jgi:hypothetical protein
LEVSTTAVYLLKRMYALLTTCPIIVDSEYWPVYTLDDPQNFVFEQNITSHAESDLFRAEGMKYINDMIVARAGTACESLVACGSTNDGSETYLDE